MFIFSLYCSVAAMFHQWDVQKEWKEEKVPPFDELFLSWNGERPTDGLYRFYIKVKTDEWSPWFLYATWGKGAQGGCIDTIDEIPIRVSYDALEILQDLKGIGFQIKVEGEGGAYLQKIDSLHVYTNGDLKEPSDLDKLAPISLPVEGLSQMEILHPRADDLCSPTSTVAALRFLTRNQAIDPLHFAKGVWDETYDIFGNWVLNIAEGWRWLGKRWGIWVERLSGFSSLHRKLEMGTPVVVSVRGPLPGGAFPYEGGHLLVVRGYDPLNKRVLCMDPAFRTAGETLVDYDIEDFMKAWGRRGQIAYVFCEKENLID